jgi:hypothetical protein
LLHPIVLASLLLTESLSAVVFCRRQAGTGPGSHHRHRQNPSDHHSQLRVAGRRWLPFRQLHVRRTPLNRRRSLIHPLLSIAADVGDCIVVRFLWCAIGSCRRDKQCEFVTCPQTGPNTWRKEVCVGLRMVLAWLMMIDDGCGGCAVTAFHRLRTQLARLVR